MFKSKGLRVSKRFALILVLAVFPVSARAISPQETEAPKVEMLTLQVVVVDPDGRPVEGAKVECSGLRSKIEPGSHWGWPQDAGTIPALTTDAEGKVEYPYPKYLTEKMEVGQVTLSVTHEAFVFWREDRSVSEPPATVTLEHGFRIAASAVDGETNEKITSDLYAVSSSYGAGDWSLQKNGILLSPTMVAKHDIIFRLVRVVDEQATHFSDRQTVTPGDRSRLMMKDIVMKPGLKLQGKLDEIVPRPIVNGQVILRIATQRHPAGQWSWADTATVDPDGNFVFAAVPHGEVVQLLAVCDGWVSAKPEKIEVVKHFPEEEGLLNGNTRSFPQPFLVEQARDDLSIKMEKTTACKIIVLGPDDKPVSGVTVGMWPNQYFFNLGSQILGTNYASAQYLYAIRNGQELKFDNDRYRATTDETGTVIIRNHPFGQTESIGVDHKTLELPQSGNNRDVSVDLKSEEINEVTIRLEKKGTTKLGESKDGDDSDD